MKARSRSCLSRIFITFAMFMALCLILFVSTIATNRNLPQKDIGDHLSPLDKARVMEAIRLRKNLGDQVWPGLGNGNISIVIWNDAFEFLVNYRGDTPSGWTIVMEDDLDGRPYFRRPADDPQNFAIRVGDFWTASIANKNTGDVFLIQSFQDIFPIPLKQAFPYRVLLQPTETHIGGVLHEVFHVHQYLTAVTRIDEAESTHAIGSSYEAAKESFDSDWRRESALLADALTADGLDEKKKFVAEFLSLRDTRRIQNGMDPDLISYEQWLEWEEGTAKYVELAILKSAGESEDYLPLQKMKNDPDFDEYKKFDQRWRQEMIQLRYQTTSGESQLYMTGMAQAFLLDDLMPGWKEVYWDEGVFLEDLLRLVVEP